VAAFSARDDDDDDDNDDDDHGVRLRQPPHLGQRRARGERPARDPPIDDAGAPALSVCCFRPTDRNGETETHET